MSGLETVEGEVEEVTKKLLGFFMKWQSGYDQK